MNMEIQQAFGNSNETKALLVNRASEAYDKGWYVHDGTVFTRLGNGNVACCALGVLTESTHGYDRYVDFEKITNMPKWFAQVIEMTYESLGQDKDASAQFTGSLIRAVPIGFSDWSGLWSKIMPAIHDGFETAINNWYAVKIEYEKECHKNDTTSCQGKFCGEDVCRFCRNMTEINDAKNNMRNSLYCLCDIYGDIGSEESFSYLHQVFKYGTDLPKYNFPAARIAELIIQTLESYKPKIGV